FVLIILLVILNIQVRFILDEEIRINLEPLDKSITVLHNESENITFELSTENFAFCRSTCNYSFIDVSRNKTLDSGSIVLKSDEKFTKDYVLASTRSGSGQNLYNFQVVCNNIRSKTCRTEESKKFKTSLVTFNYRLSEEEEQIKNDMQERLPSYFETVLGVKARLNQTKSLLETSFTALNAKNQYPTLVEQQTLLESSLAEHDASALQKMWSFENYFGLAQAFTEKVAGDATMLEQQASEHLSLVIGLIEEYNTAVKLAQDFLSEESLMNDILKFYIMTGNASQASSLQNLATAFKNTIDNFDVLEGKDLTRALETYAQRLAVIEEQYFKDTGILGLTTAFEVYRTELRISLLKHHRNAEPNALRRDSISKILDEQFDLDLILSDCGRLDELSDTISVMNELAVSMTADKYSQIIDNQDFLNSIAIHEAYLVAETENLLQQELAELEGNLSESDEKLQIISNLIKPSGQPDLSMTVDFIEGISVNDYWNLISLLLPKACFFNDTNESIDLGSRQLQILDVEIDSMKIDSNNTSFVLEDNFDVCCAFGECQECCDSEECREEADYPVIFVHGHAFNEQNSPEASLSAFASIQRLLGQDGFVNAGQFDMGGSESDIEYGEWGRSGKPVSIRVSYYYIRYYDLGKYILTTQKSENIENYAIRLKEFIDLVKYRTGAKKVNIVAHSMGGLVAREYLALFGEGNVGKLIMVGTPNKGIKGKVASLCGLKGAGIECDEMKEDSIFLKRLNDPQNAPTQTRIYTIRGSGCDMEGEDGDGIVVAENVPLDYATNFVVDGACSDFLNAELHSRMLSPSTYPETYSLIVAMLKE
ncbi:alpha/beta fold hydrolase, partial [Candidatus Woesearchaeota archaeon]|nr:alpha/beta fold hydrolase [Candidatus Woesearchaeota archaeon]